MSRSGVSAARLERMREVLTRHVDSGEVPGLVAAVARRGEVHVMTLGRTEAGGGGTPMRRDAIFRVASVTKQITAAAAIPGAPAWALAPAASAGPAAPAPRSTPTRPRRWC
jgi:CubicO group peptidase (beta-lactamase class C family)